MQYLSSIANTAPFRYLAIIPIIYCILKLHATPPTNNTYFEFQCAIALSVTSTSIENIVYCSEKHKSYFVYLLFLAISAANVYIPEKETSIPLTI